MPIWLSKAHIIKAYNLHLKTFKITFVVYGASFPRNCFFNIK